MKKDPSKKVFNLRAALVLSLLLAAFGFIPTMDKVPDLAIFIGRFHPLIVHMPIGFLMVLLLLESVVVITKHRHDIGIRVVLWFTVFAAIASSAVGSLLAFPGGYDELILSRHRWLGLATTVITIWMLQTHRSERRGSNFLYRLLLLGAMGLVSVAGHLGGSLTHGEDYLTAYLPPILGGEPVAEPIDMGSLEDAALFEGAIQPMLKQKCVSCHAPGKNKGELRLHDYENIMLGGKNGPTLVLGDANGSLTVKRIELPESDKKHMPPKGKPQFTQAETDLLKWWINNGAPKRLAITDNLPSDEAVALLESKLGFPIAQPKLEFMPWEDLITATERLQNNPEVRLRRISLDSPAINVVVEPSTNNIDALIAQFEPFKANITLLDLGSTTISDLALESIAQFTNLEELRLHNTAVTDQGIAKLEPLRQLQKINLYGTPTTDKALVSLRKLPKLRQIVAWETQISKQGAHKFIEQSVDKAKQRKLQHEIQQLHTELKEMEVHVIGTEPVPKTIVDSLSWEANDFAKSPLWTSLSFKLEEPLQRSGSYELSLKLDEKATPIIVHDRTIKLGDQVVAGSYIEKTLTTNAPIVFPFSIEEVSTNQCSINVLVHSDTDTPGEGSLTLRWLKPELSTNAPPPLPPEAQFHRNPAVYGNLISATAKLASSSTCKYHKEKNFPKLTQHSKNKQQYAFCTDKEKNPWVSFTLDRKHTLTALIVENRRDGWKHRTKGMILETTADGENWTTIWEAAEPQDEWVIDLSQNEIGPRDIKQFRFRGVGLDDYFHLSQVRFWGIQTEKDPPPARYQDHRGVFIGAESTVSVSSTSIYTPKRGLRKLTQLATNSLEFAFHTKAEKNPWVQFSYPEPTALSAITIENRTDFLSRSKNMVLESSQDGQHWVMLKDLNPPEQTWQLDLSSLPMAERKAKHFRLRLNVKDSVEFHLKQVHLWGPSKK